jgi:hypothetical protein
MSLGSELSWKYAVLSELLVKPVVYMHPEPVEDVHMVSEQMEDVHMVSERMEDVHMVSEQMEDERWG